MSGLFLPILLAFLGLATALFTYRNIRRGGARFYTLEREAILRQASLTLLASVLLFGGAIGLLLFERQQSDTLPGDANAESGTTAVSPTPDPAQNLFPPTPSPTATPDLTLPTPTATPTICRGVVEGTFGNGLTLRDTPGGGEVAILQDGSILTVLPEPSQQVNGFTWIRVRSVFGDEGWVADEFVTLGLGCNIDTTTP